MNTLPQLWGEDAKEFKPERWLGLEDGKTPGGSRYAFQSFIHGALAHSCLCIPCAQPGVQVLTAASAPRCAASASAWLSRRILARAQMSMLEMKAMLVHFFANFEFTLPPDYKPPVPKAAITCVAAALFLPSHE